MALLVIIFSYKMENVRFYYANLNNIKKRCFNLLIYNNHLPYKRWVEFRAPHACIIYVKSSILRSHTIFIVTLNTSGELYRWIQTLHTHTPIVYGRHYLNLSTFCIQMAARRLFWFTQCTNPQQQYTHNRIFLYSKVKGLMIKKHKKNKFDPDFFLESVSKFFVWYVVPESRVGQTAAQQLGGERSRRYRGQKKKKLPKTIPKIKKNCKINT